MNELDVLLISAPSPNPAMQYAFKRQGMPPLGLGYLATCLKQEGYSVKIIDMGFENNTMKTVLSVLENNKVCIVGFSCTTETYNVSVRMADRIRETYRDCIIVFGGPHVSFEYKAALSNMSIDYVLLNEGEHSLKKFCDCFIRGIGTLDQLRGIAYRQEGCVVCAEPEPFITDLDTLPFPDRTLFEDLHRYALPSSIVTSRGCPGKCIFCAASVLSGGRYRMRSALNVVREFEYLKSLGFRHVNIIDDTMTANLKRLDEILDELIMRKLQMSWYCESRVDVMSKDMLKKMKDAGLVIVQFGVESGNQRILDSIKKNIKLEKIKEVFNWCREMGIMASTNLIIGQPFDDEASIEDTISLAKELTLLGAGVNFTVCTPFPGTPLWLRPEEFGIELIDHNLDHYSTFYPVFNTKLLRADQIRNAYYRAVKTVNKLRLETHITGTQKGIRMTDSF